MAREILFREKDEIVGFGEIEDLPVGVPTWVTFKSDVTGVSDPSLSGKNEGGGIITRTANDKIEANYIGVLKTNDGRRLRWDSDENSDKKDRGKVEGKEKVRIRDRQFPQPIDMDTTMDSKKVTNTAYK
jgi:hypothetical protein